MEGLELNARLLKRDLKVVQNLRRHVDNLLADDRLGSVNDRVAECYQLTKVMKQQLVDSLTPEEKFSKSSVGHTSWRPWRE